MKKILLISSMGGHLEELLQLEKLFRKYDFLIVCEKSKVTKFLKTRFGKKAKYLFYGTIDHIFKYLFILPLNFLKSLYYFLIFRPDVVITTGTHTAILMCLIAKFFRKKVIYIETFANRNTKTKTGNFLYGKVDLFIVQWPQLLELYPDAKYWGWIF